MSDRTLSPKYPSNAAIIPGLISDHSHVGIFVGLKAAPENYNRDAILRQLKQLEAYGVTTVMALGLNGPLFYELRPELHAGRIPQTSLEPTRESVWLVASHRRRSFQLARTRSRDRTPWRWRVSRSVRWPRARPTWSRSGSIAPAG